MLAFVKVRNVDTLSNSTTGSQTWNIQGTADYTNSGSISTETYFAIYTGSGASPAWSMAASGSGALLSVDILAYRPTTGSSWDSAANVTNTYANVNNATDLIVASQTPTASASVISIASWMIYDSSTVSSLTGGWTQRGNSSGINNADAAHFRDLSRAYADKIQASAAATGAVHLTASALTYAVVSMITIKETVDPTPTFSAGPTYAKVDANTIRATFTCNSSAPTAKAGLYVAGASTPTAAQVAAGTSAHGTNTAACTGSSQTLDIDATDSPVLPDYDPYVVLDSSGNLSSVPATTTTCVDAPSGKQFVNCPAGLTAVNSTDSIPAKWNALLLKTLAYGSQSVNFTLGAILVGSTSGAYGVIQADADNGAGGTVIVEQRSSDPFQNGELITDNRGGSALIISAPASYEQLSTSDILVEPTTTSTGSYALTITADGQFSYSGTGRQKALDGLIYQSTSHSYLSVDIDFFDHNTPPTTSGGITQLVLTTGASQSIDLNAYLIDPDAIAMTFGKLTTTDIPGMTLDADTGIFSGTPTFEVEAGVALTFGALDDAQELTTKQFLLYPITTWTLTDCVSVQTLLAACQDAITSLMKGAVFFPPVTTASSPTVPVGYVISQTPTAGAEIAPFASVDLVISTGNGLVSVPNCLAQTVSQCTVLMHDIAPSGSVVQGTGCTGFDSVIYSQGPAVTVPATDTFTMTVYCR